MEIRQLRYFQAVAETLNFSRAAERLHVAQPALSRQIRSLEEELGVQLLVRSTVRVRLTDAGRNFYERLDKLQHAFEEAVNSTQAIARGTGGHFNVGSDWRLPMPELLKALLSFRASHPDVVVNLVDLPLHEHVGALRDGRIHLGVTLPEYLGTHDDLDLMRLSTAETRVALAARHPLAEEPLVRVRQLREETWLLLDERTTPGYRSQIVQLCRLAQFTPRFGLVAQSIDALLGHVAAGDGICLIPDTLVPRSNNDLLRFPPTDCAPLELYAAWLREGSCPLVPAFLASVREELFEKKTPMAKA